MTNHNTNCLRTIFQNLKYNCSVILKTSENRIHTVRIDNTTRNGRKLIADSTGCGTGKNANKLNKTNIIIKTF